MTNLEFAEIIGFIASGCGKSLTPESQIVYFDLLGDLPAATLWPAARRVLLEHKWATFPSIAELRQAAVDAARGDVKELSAAEAWNIAWAAACKIDPEVDGSIERGLANVPALVREAMRAFGLASLCMSGGDDFEGRPRPVDRVSIQRAQFVAIYEQLAARDRRSALLPAATHAALAARRAELNGPVRQAIAGIGRNVSQE